MSDEEGGSSFYLSHDTITPEEYLKLIDEIVVRLLPDEIEQKKKYIEREFFRQIETTINNEYNFWPTTEDKQLLIAHCFDGYNAQHSVRYGDLYYRVLDILRDEYHFQNFQFDAQYSKSYFGEVATFEMEVKK